MPPWAGTVLRLLVGGVWVVTGALKLPDPAAAERAVRAYQLAPEALVPVLAFGLPVLEIAVGLLLLTGAFVRPAAVASALLLAGFTAAVASAWARGLTIDCGCFGGGGEVDADRTAYLSEIVRDVALLGASVLLAVRPRTRLALTDRAAPRGGPDA
ncbi:MauE/DoxX family redox-associated membrane protein [Blastococcus sp. SYSU D00813]